MAVTKRTRFEVLRRDNFTCRYCRSTEGELTIDHVTPVALGGTDEPDNLVAACRDCNAGKGSTGPDEGTVADVAEDAVRWAAAVKQAAEQMVAVGGARQAYIDSFVEAWPSYRHIPDSLINTVGSLYDAGLPIEVMLECARVADTARNVYDRPAYFAGMCWKRVQTLHDAARELLAGQGAGGDR